MSKIYLNSGVREYMNLCFRGRSTEYPTQGLVHVLFHWAHTHTITK